MRITDYNKDTDIGFGNQVVILQCSLF